MKREVLRLILGLRVPIQVRSFSDLHDYIDANELGGFCDDKFCDELIAHFGGRDAYNDGMPDGMLSYMNACQDAVGEWLGREGHVERIEELGCGEDFTAQDYGALLVKHKAALRALDQIRCTSVYSDTTIGDLISIAYKAWKEAQ